MKNDQEIRIDSEFASLIPPLSADERTQLEANILADGCREALVVWREESVLIDGHNRFGICRTHDLKFQTKKISFADRDAAKRWMIVNQIGRRNLAPEALAYLRGKLYREEKKQGARTDLTSTQSEEKSETTAERLAEQFKVSRATVERDGKFSEQLDELAEDLGEDFRQQVLGRDTRFTRKDIAELLGLDPEDRRSIISSIDSGEAKTARAALVATRPSTTDLTAEFHPMVALAELRDRIDRLVSDTLKGWPVEARKSVPGLISDLSLDFAERLEC
jgi:hypothetical protein